jgi:polyferredoxin
MINILTLPFFKQMARWRYGRLMLQIPFTLIAVLLIYDGFTGSQHAPENLATVGIWVHYRGVLILMLLFMGNLFCMGCPFTLPRTLAKRLSKRGRRFPRILRHKGLAIFSLLLIFFLYEYLDMWASPMLTAWVIVAYFVLSFAFEALFTESAFCKYVCPLGTFNFVYSALAPTQISVKNRDICKQCVGKECINGSYAPQTIIRLDSITINGATTEKQVIHSPKGTLGCGTELFAPQIRSNFDCTVCLDCIRACPHDNIGWYTRRFGRELADDSAWSKRWDISFLLIGLAFWGLLNAFGMIPPVYDLMQSLANGLGLPALGWSDEAIELVVFAIIFVIGGVIAPIGVMLLAGIFTRVVVHPPIANLRVIIGNFAPAFIPIGFGIWLAHYAFHLLSGLFTIVPTAQFFLIDHNITVFGDKPNWSLGGVDMSIIGIVQLLALGGGLLWSLALVQKISLHHFRRQATLPTLIWGGVIVALMLVAVWIFAFNDMEMRGTVLFH